MTAQVNVEIEQTTEALQVPIQSVLGRNGHYYVAVPSEDGSLQSLEVTVGSSNEENVVILDGLTSGDQVAMGIRNLAADLDLPIGDSTEPATESDTSSSGKPRKDKSSKPPQTAERSLKKAGKPKKI